MGDVPDDTTPVGSDKIRDVPDDTTPTGSDKSVGAQDYSSLDRQGLIRLVEEGRQAQAKLEQIGIDLVARTLEAEAASVAKSRFLASVTHELRTPLHTILGYVRLVIGECDGESRRQLQIVERSAGHLLKLINDLLEYNSLDDRSNSIQAEPMSLAGLIEHVNQVSERYAGMSNARFDMSLPADLPDQIEADEGRLFQVLDNLVSNACKYARDGIVTLSVSSGPVPDSDPGAHANRCRLCFSVSDSGIGIPPDSLAAIFLPFGRAANAHRYPGMGLGLAIAGQLVQAMGGRLEVESSPGEGSRFYFSIDVTVSASSGIPEPRAVATTHGIASLTESRSGSPGSRRSGQDASHPSGAFSAQSPVGAAGITLSLPREAIGQLREFVDLGRVIRIAQWAESLATSPHANRPLLGRIARLAREADLLALRRLVAEIVPAPK